MSKMTDSAKLVSRFESALRCPHCENPMKVAGLKSLVCPNNHTFDFTKQGYVNLLPRPSAGNYKKELFEARHKIVVETGLYASMHKTVGKAIKEYADAGNPCLVADLGCGEGSHLYKILDECDNPEVTGVGLDISKEGIIMASKRYDRSIWFVGDLAKSPFADQSFPIVLNILAPSNYKEFKRMLVRDGLAIKVVPGPDYLRELREALYDDDEKRAYTNEDTVSLFKTHFHMQHLFHLNDTKKLNQAERQQLVQMTPLAWSRDQARIDAYLDRDVSEITIDLHILVGKYTE